LIDVMFESASNDRGLTRVLARGDHHAAWQEAMHRGDLATAWTINDAVLAAGDPSDRDNPRLPYHLRWVWDGRSFQNRHVLIRCYHGLGDTLQFARYLPRIRPLVASLTVEAQPELLPLLASVPGPDRLIPFDPAHPAPAADCDIEIMELAHALRLPPEDGQVPLLRVAPSPLPRGAVGLRWMAGDWDPGRSIDPDLLGDITARPCVSLQPAKTHLRMLNAGGCTRDIGETAALISGLDLVITVDTMIAHLAGALNRPVWVLLKHEADWRWMRERADSPWYPSMRLYRQRTPGDWATVVALVGADLAMRLASVDKLPGASLVPCPTGCRM
jgi:hypothetical protein